MKFEAKKIGIVEEYDTITVGFAEDESEPSQYVLIQRGLEPSEQDRRLGHDKVYLQVNNELDCAYVDIEEAVLDQDRLSIKLGPETARKIGVDDMIEIRLADPNESLAAIGEACRRIFDARCFRGL